MQYSDIYRCYSRDDELPMTTTSVQVFLHLSGVNCNLQQHNQITTFTLNYHPAESGTWGLSSIMATPIILDAGLQYLSKILFFFSQ